jgi:hypothetical protein
MKQEAEYIVQKLKHLNETNDYKLGVEIGYIMGRLSVEGSYRGYVIPENVEQLKLLAEFNNLYIEVGSNSIGTDLCFVVMEELNLNV